MNYHLFVQKLLLFHLAIVSLPKETFMPSGTGVRTTLLFLQKKTAEEITKEKSEVTKYKLNFLKSSKTELAKLLEDINQNTKAGKTKAKKVTDIHEARMQKKAEEEFLRVNSYPVFLSVAKHVGYDATGKPTKNDLYETDTDGKVIKDKGILGEYRKFKRDPLNYKFSDVLQLIGVKDE